MKISKFALGVRFAAMAEQPPKEFARKISVFQLRILYVPVVLLLAHQLLKMKKLRK